MLNLDEIKTYIYTHKSNSSQEISEASEQDFVLEILCTCHLANSWTIPNRSSRCLNMLQTVTAMQFSSFVMLMATF